MVTIKPIELDAAILPENKFFFDTNVWIYLNFPESISRDHLKTLEPYTNLLELIVGGSAQIYINYVTVLEVANYIIYSKKQSYISLTKDKADKLAFRSHSYYKDALKSINNTITEILQHAQFDNNNNSDFNLTDFIKNFVTLEQIDLNDLYILDYCKANDFIFVTNDSDCLVYNDNVTVLTANKNLLKQVK